MEHIQTWRELLGTALRDTSEKQRVANELGVSTVTLARWINGESDPRPQKLRALFSALPAYKKQLIALVSSEFGDVVDPSDDLVGTHETIPAEFYSQVLKTHTTVPEQLHFWTMADLIINQMLLHLDPSRRGMVITIAQCMPPRGEGFKIRSFREVLWRGTPPWSSNLEQRHFLGAESLGGYATLTGRYAVFQDSITNQRLFSPSESAYELSAIAYPIRRAASIAGCITISSTLPNYFTPARQKQVEDYADLFVLAFDKEFYPQEYIDLQLMPSHKVQESYFVSFNERVLGVMREIPPTGRSLTRLEAEQMVWQYFEDEMLRMQPVDRLQDTL